MNVTMKKDFDLCRALGRLIQIDGSLLMKGFLEDKSIF